MNAADRTAEVTHFSKHADWTGASDAERGSWLAHRQGLLTASSMAAILGEDQYRDAFDVFVEKTTTRLHEEIITIDDPRFWGSVLEQPILTTVASYYGWDYRKGGALLRSKAHPLFGSTLDAEIDRRDGRGWGCLEGKTTVVTKDWDEETGELPTRVLIQAQHQLLVTGAPFCAVFALLVGSRPCLIEVEPSAEFHAMIVDAGLEFHDRLLRGDCPQPTARSNVSRRYNHDGDGSTVQLPIEFVELTRDYFETNTELARLAAAKQEIQNRIRDAIGDATFGELPEAVNEKLVWKWAEEFKKEYVVAAQSGRVLRPLKGFPNEKKQRAGIAHATVTSELGDETAQRFKKGRRRIR